MQHGDLWVEDVLAEFVANELTPGSGVEPGQFWDGMVAICEALHDRNVELLARRDELQSAIDTWHLERRGEAHDPAAYEAFLRDIGYIADAPDRVSVQTENVDPEIATVAGPQLVVPLDNARYALNAANARWGSLYDALYGTDVLGEDGGATRGGRYNPIRGDKVVAACRAFLDRHFELAAASHAWATAYHVVDGALLVRVGDGRDVGLVLPEQFAGYTGDASSPSSVMLSKHGLHCEIRIDRDHAIGRTDHAGVCDIRLESAVTSIMDCEDSVSAVDLDDKLVVYGNWLGLIKGTLKASFEKGDTTVDRALEDDIDLIRPDGTPDTLPGRALMLVRNVGHHLRTPIATWKGEPIFETMLDAMITALAAKHDLLDNGTYRNSTEGSIHIVKPKLHGPDEVALACELFTMVEDALGLARNTMKMGIMDEERRTTLNLAACLEHAEHRVVFINTGFLDRTGDEIHTDMEAGPMIPKGAMKSATWLLTYEDWNVDVGLACGLLGRAQIGKGMWARPNDMAEMLDTKIQHPMAGASCAWVPSPTAATLHALHYFTVDVADRQRRYADRAPAELDDLLMIPVLGPDEIPSDEDVARELANNCQSILGYVVRWVGQGVGCSTVPDIDDVGLMEDLATLRISSQHVANWLHHGLVTDEQVRATMATMAAAVDRQNADDPAYEPMAPDVDASIPFQAALDLVLGGRDEPNGYTERFLRARRLELKDGS